MATESGFPPMLPPGRETERDFLPISDYGLIGDGHGAALVGRDGSIDWCCFERFDAPPSFARLLDRRRGGFLHIRPEEAITCVRRFYQDETALLETMMETASGTVVITDFMPVAARPEGGTGPAGWIIRLVEGRMGEVAMRATHRPMRSLEEDPPSLSIARGEHCVCAEGCPSLHGEVPFALERCTGSELAVARFTLRAGERKAFVLAPQDASVEDPAATAAEFLHTTQTFWRAWVKRIVYHGSYRAEVVRSALVLKLLIHESTGAMVAAPTTSLPESIGGCRNWDYRFCWPRDASFVLYALQKLGLREETERFFRFLLEAVEKTLPSVPPLFALDGAAMSLEEREVEGLEGYMGSRPVRFGNEAAEQHQLDVYGQLLDLMHLHACVGDSPNGELRHVGTTLADHVAAGWRDPDHGIWEPRLEPRRHVHSAMMAWVALDRARRLFGPRAAWDEAEKAVLEDIRKHGIHPTGGYLTQVMGGEETDGALLLAPILDLPLDQVTLERTVDRVIETLGDGPLVKRYRNEDGLPGEEGTFLACAFWLVDALLMLDRGDEARERFEALVERGNDLGLYAEEMASDGTFLGNFPQAFTHLGLVQSALLLDQYAVGGVESLRGTHADRARRMADRAPSRGGGQ